MKYYKACPKCGCNSLVLDFKYSRPYLFIACNMKCGFVFGQNHKLLDLPEFMNTTGFEKGILELEELTKEQKNEVKRDCGIRFNSVLKNPIPEHMAMIFEPLSFKEKVRFRYRFYLNKVSPIFLKLYWLLPHRKPKDCDNTPAW